MGLFFQDERDHDFFKACERVRRTYREFNSSDIAKIAIYTQAESFYLTYKGYKNIILKIRHNERFPDSTKASLYDEIKKRMSEIKGVDEMSAGKIARILDEQPAPRFYISESRAVSIYYNQLRNGNK
jgi:hypothetical protein